MRIARAAVLTLALASANTADAGLLPFVQISQEDYSSISGRWIAESGASLTIRVVGSTATIWGSDQGSSFVSRCRLNASQGGLAATCSGDGYNLEGESFDYASDIVFGQEELVENWRAFFQENGSIRELSGEESFKRQSGR